MTADMNLDRKGFEIAFTQVRGLGMGSTPGQSLRQYIESHPWITFELNLNRLDDRTWMRVGEALSKCDHIAGVPLQPSVADQLHLVYLIKGVHATTQIEGNTLSEDEVGRRISGQLPLPESQEYLGKEIDNILAACNQIMREARSSEGCTPLTRSRIEEFNALVLRDLPVDPGTQPGRMRTRSVVVGNVYRGAPSEDCPYLIDQLCGWIAELRTSVPEYLRRPMSLISAIMAHLYLAWIHPFDDGNGRTARLIEFQLLVEAGIPFPAAHLLSDYYNKTRTRYYQALAETSRPPYAVERFIGYAMTGFVEELRSQLSFIRDQQITVAWVNYVHDKCRGLKPVTGRRQRELVLALPPGEFTPVSAIPRLTPELVEAYVGKQQKTVTRDVNQLLALELIEKSGHAVRPRIERMSAFLPARAEAPIAVS